MRIGLIDADLMWRPRANGRRYGHQKADIFHMVDTFEKYDKIKAKE